MLHGTIDFDKYSRVNVIRELQAYISYRMTEKQRQHNQAHQTCSNTMNFYSNLVLKPCNYSTSDINAITTDAVRNVTSVSMDNSTVYAVIY